MTNDYECVAYGEFCVTCGLTVINDICDRKLIVSHASIRREERKSSTNQQNVTRLTAAKDLEATDKV